MASAGQQCIYVELLSLLSVPNREYTQLLVFVPRVLSTTCVIVIRAICPINGSVFDPKRKRAQGTGGIPIWPVLSLSLSLSLSLVRVRCPPYQNKTHKVVRMVVPRIRG